MTRDITLINKFCSTGDIKYFDRMSQKIKSFFYLVCEYLVTDSDTIGVYNKKIANLVYKYVNTKIRSLGKQKTPIYISAFKRGVPVPTVKGAVNINVTSGSNNKIDGVSAAQASPMYLGNIDNTLLATEDLSTPTNANIFENFWQYSKVYKELDHIDKSGNVTQKWKTFRDKGFRKNKGDRHADGTKSKEVIGKCMMYGRECNKYAYYKPQFSVYYDESGEQIKYDYVDARKYVYIPTYAALVKETQFFKNLKQKVDNGFVVNIVDYDGPKGPGDSLLTVKIDIDTLKERVNDPSQPFGHGYVIAALLVGIEPYMYI